MQYTFFQNIFKIFFASSSRNSEPIYDVLIANIKQKSKSDFINGLRLENIDAHTSHLSTPIIAGKRNIIDKTNFREDAREVTYVQFGCHIVFSRHSTFGKREMLLIEQEDLLKRLTVFLFELIESNAPFSSLSLRYHGGGHFLVEMQDSKLQNTMTCDEFNITIQKIKDIHNVQTVRKQIKNIRKILLDAATWSMIEAERAFQVDAAESKQKTIAPKIQRIN